MSRLFGKSIIRWPFNMHMKKIIVLPVMAMMAIAAIPDQSQALSCLDQESMVTHIVSDPDYIVVTAVPTANKEFVKEKATEAHLHDSGYTGQFLKISEAHKGSVSEQQWVYFTKDSTWEYLCAGEPPALNTERIYVI